MAFDVKKLSGLASGSGKAPNLFTYTSADNVATATTDGYFNGIKAGIEPNDIIYALLLNDTAPALTVLVCVKAEYVDGAGFSVDFSTYSSFVGDVRATDAAGLLLDNLSGSLGMGGGSAALANARTFTYRNNTDSTATIAGAGYFNGAAAALEEADLIATVANNGFDYLRVTDITEGVVTTAVIALA